MHRSYFTIAEIMLVFAVAAIFLSARQVAVKDRGISTDIDALMNLRANSGAIIGAIIGVGIGASAPQKNCGNHLGEFSAAA